MERVIESYLYPYFKILDNIPYQHNTLHFMVAVFIGIVFGSVGIFGFTILERDICENIKNEHSRSFITKASKWFIRFLKYFTILSTLWSFSFVPLFLFGTNRSSEVVTEIEPKVIYRIGNKVSATLTGWYNIKSDEVVTYQQVSGFKEEPTQVILSKDGVDAGMKITAAIVEVSYLDEESKANSELAEYQIREISLTKVKRIYLVLGRRFEKELKGVKVVFNVKTPKYSPAKEKAKQELEELMDLEGSNE
jgi:hypothetical protein